MNELNNVKKRDNYINSKFISALISKGKLTKKEICERAGIARISFDQMLDGSNVRVGTLVSVAKALGVHPGELLVGEDFPSIRISTNGDYSPGVMGEGSAVTVYAGGHPQERIKTLEEKVRLQEEIISLYRSIHGSTPCDGSAVK